MVWDNDHISGHQPVRHFVGGIFAGLISMAVLTALMPSPLSDIWAYPADIILQKFVRERFVERRYDRCP